MREDLKISLYLTYYFDSSPARAEENRRCLDRNIANTEIDEIWLFVDVLEPYRELESGKVRLALTAGSRATYRDFIEHANARDEAFVLLMANTDIYFDETAGLLREAVGPEELICLGRRDVRADGSAPHTEHYASSDAWALRTPVRPFFCDVRLGVMHCESTFLGYAQGAGYSVRNVGLDVSAFHLHITQKRNYNPNVDVYRDYDVMIYPELGSLPKKRSVSPGGPRVAVDGAVFQTNRVGWARYWASILEHWSKDEFGRRVVVLDRAGSAPRFEGLSYHPAPNYNPNLPVTSGVVLQHVLDDAGADLFVSTCYTTPLDTPSVGFVYDMLPETLHANLEMFRDKYATITQARRFCVPSESAAGSLAAFSKRIGRDAIDVVPPAVSEGFAPSTAVRIEKLRARLGLDRPYFLYIGERSGFCNYPNAEVVFKAFAGMPDRSKYLLLFVGGHPEMEQKFLAMIDRNDVRQAFLEDNDLVDAYSGALALIYPSLRPRLGMSILEAMRCRCPVIAAREAVSAEVGECVLQFSASDAEQLRGLLTLAQERSLRERLSTRGYQHSFRFSWRDSAERLKAALLEAAR